MCWFHSWRTFELRTATEKGATQDEWRICRKCGKVELECSSMYMRGRTNGPEYWGITDIRKIYQAWKLHFENPECKTYEILPNNRFKIVPIGEEKKG